MRGSSHATLSAGEEHARGRSSVAAARRGGARAVRRGARAVRVQCGARAVRCARTDEAVLQHEVHHAVLQGVDPRHERRAQHGVQRALPRLIHRRAAAQGVPRALAHCHVRRRQLWTCDCFEGWLVGVSPPQTDRQTDRYMVENEDPNCLPDAASVHHRTAANEQQWRVRG